MARSLIVRCSALTQNQAKQAVLFRHPVTAAVPSATGDLTAAREMATLGGLACHCCYPSPMPLAWYMGLPNWPSHTRVHSADISPIG
mmetsp:Transcript_69363/g.175115  ORF Transcript_69363/g.175115 Transcript_69363/m.175115 type:complete len:87 (-) Transcript_69363:25-285(-)